MKAATLSERLHTPSFLDTLGAHFLLPLQFARRKYPVPDMLAIWVVEHLDIVEQVLHGFGSGLACQAPYPLPLEQIE